jgi:hypothetical protein
MGNWDRFEHLEDDWKQIQRCDWFYFLFYDSLVYKTGIIYIYDKQRRCSCIRISYDSLCVQNRECFTSLTSKARADEEIRNSIRILFATVVPWEMQNCSSFRSLKGFIFEKRSRSRRNWDHRIVEPSLENMLLWEQALDPPPHHVLNILGLLQTLAPKIGSSTKWSKTWRVCQHRKENKNAICFFS